MEVASLFSVQLWLKGSSHTGKGASSKEARCFSSRNVGLSSKTLLWYRFISRLIMCLLKADFSIRSEYQKEMARAAEPRWPPKSSLASASATSAPAEVPQTSTLQWDHQEETLVSARELPQDPRSLTLPEANPNRVGILKEPGNSSSELELEIQAAIEKASEIVRGSSFNQVFKFSELNVLEAQVEAKIKKALEKKDKNSRLRNQSVLALEEMFKKRISELRHEESSKYPRTSLQNCQDSDSIDNPEEQPTSAIQTQNERATSHNQFYRHSTEAQRKLEEKYRIDRRCFNYAMIHPSYILEQSEMQYLAIAFPFFQAHGDPNFNLQPAGSSSQQAYQMQMAQYTAQQTQASGVAPFGHAPPFMSNQEPRIFCLVCFEELRPSYEGAEEHLKSHHIDLVAVRLKTRKEIIDRRLDVGFLKESYFRCFRQDDELLPLCLFCGFVGERRTPRRGTPTDPLHRFNQVLVHFGRHGIIPGGWSPESKALRAEKRSVFARKHQPSLQKRQALMRRLAQQFPVICNDLIGGFNPRVNSRGDFYSTDEVRDGQNLEKAYPITFYCKHCPAAAISPEKIVRHLEVLHGSRFEIQDALQFSQELNMLVEVPWRSNTQATEQDFDEGDWLSQIELQTGRKLSQKPILQEPSASPTKSVPSQKSESELSKSPRPHQEAEDQGTAHPPCYRPAKTFLIEPRRTPLSIRWGQCWYDITSTKPSPLLSFISSLREAEVMFKKKLRDSTVALSKKKGNPPSSNSTFYKWLESLNYTYNKFQAKSLELNSHYIGAVFRVYLRLLRSIKPDLEFENYLARLRTRPLVAAHPSLKLEEDWVPEKKKPEPTIAMMSAFSAEKEVVMRIKKALSSNPGLEESLHLERAPILKRPSGPEFGGVSNPVASRRPTLQDQIRKPVTAVSLGIQSESRFQPHIKPARETPLTIVESAAANTPPPTATSSELPITSKPEIKARYGRPTAENASGLQLSAPPSSQPPDQTNLNLNQLQQPANKLPQTSPSPELKVDPQFKKPRESAPPAFPPEQSSMFIEKAEPPPYSFIPASQLSIKQEEQPNMAMMQSQFSQLPPPEFSQISYAPHGPGEMMRSDFHRMSSSQMSHLGISQLVSQPTDMPIEKQTNLSMLPQGRRRGRRGEGFRSKILEKLMQTSQKFGGGSNAPGAVSEPMEMGPSGLARKAPPSEITEAPTEQPPASIGATSIAGVATSNFDPAGGPTPTASSPIQVRQTACGFSHSTPHPADQIDTPYFVPPEGAYVRVFEKKFCRTPAYLARFEQALDKELSEMTSAGLRGSKPSQWLDGGFAFLSSALHLFEFLETDPAVADYNLKQEDLEQEFEEEDLQLQLEAYEYFDPRSDPECNKPDCVELDSLARVSSRDMTSLQILEQVEGLFETFPNLKYDQATQYAFSENEALKIQFTIRKAVLLLSSKVLSESPAPTVIKFTQEGHQFQDIIASIDDSRCLANILEITEWPLEEQEKIHLIPQFLETFDFAGIADTFILEQRILASSVMRGMYFDLYKIEHSPTETHCHFRCLEYASGCKALLKYTLKYTDVSRLPEPGSETWFGSLPSAGGCMIQPFAKLGQQFKPQIKPLQQPQSIGAIVEKPKSNTCQQQSDYQSSSLQVREQQPRSNQPLSQTLAGAKPKFQTCKVESNNSTGLFRKKGTSFRLSKFYNLHNHSLDITAFREQVNQQLQIRIKNAIQ